MTREHIPPGTYDWVYTIPSADIDEKPTSLTIVPDEDDRGKIANRLEIVSVDALEANLELSRHQDKLRIHVTGSFAATVTQECVKTLKPVQSEIVEEFDAWFADEAEVVTFEKVKRERMLKMGQTEMPILEEFEDPEPLKGGQIDLGDLVTQYLSLALPPFPLHKSVPLDDEEEAQAERRGSPDNPFAALKNWRETHRDPSKQ